MANTVEHPPNVHVAEHEVLAPLDVWLAGLFAPDRLADTLRCFCDAQDDRPDPAATAAARIIAECYAKLARYRSALEAGGDPAVVAGWIAETQAARAAAAGPSRPARPANCRMTE